jgi:hypothetical protein
MQQLVQKYMSQPCRRNDAGGHPSKWRQENAKTDDKRRFASLADPEEAHVECSANVVADPNQPNFSAKEQEIRNQLENSVSHVERAANAPKGGRGLGGSSLQPGYPLPLSEDLD